MAIIKPFGKNIGEDLWFHITQRRAGDVDLMDKYFGIKGEFSPFIDIAFNKHIKRLDSLSHSTFFNKFNGRKIKEIRKVEKFWY